MVAVAGGPVCGYGSEEHARGHSPRACLRHAPAPRPAAQPRRSRPGPSPLLHPMGAMPARLTMALMHAVWSFGRLQGPQAGVTVAGRMWGGSLKIKMQNPDFEPCEMKRFHFGGSEILSKPSGFPRDKGAFLVADWGGTSSHDAIPKFSPRELAGQHLLSHAGQHPCLTSCRPHCTGTGGRSRCRQFLISSIHAPRGEGLAHHTHPHPSSCPSAHHWCTCVPTPAFTSNNSMSIETTASAQPRAQRWSLRTKFWY